MACPAFCPLLFAGAYLGIDMIGHKLCRKMLHIDNQ
jgi:hypothetical protein